MIRNWVYTFTIKSLGITRICSVVLIVVREWYIASWGNGIEPYNMYRRTGYPTLQTGVVPVGVFPRSFRYPASEVNTNPNVQQTTADNQVFWDTNPAGFIN